MEPSTTSPTSKHAPQVHSNQVAIKHRRPWFPVCRCRSCSSASGCSSIPILDLPSHAGQFLVRLGPFEQGLLLGPGKLCLTLELTPECILRVRWSLGSLLQIGNVAERTGLTADAIRFYERERLLHTATRSSGGFRLFSGSDVADLKFIRNAQELGFSLEEIRELLGLKHASHPDCRVVEELVEHKLEIVRGKIASLRKLERELRQAAAECKSNLGHANNGQAENCPVLEDISRGRRRQKK